MATTFTRPVDIRGNTVAPIETTGLRKPGGLLSFSQNGYPQGRDTGATKRRWTERYPPMALTSAVQTFLDNVDTYKNQRTDLDVTVKNRSSDIVVTAKIVDYSEYKVRAGRMVFGLEISFAEV